MDLWSNGNHYTLTFKDFILVSPADEHFKKKNLFDLRDNIINAKDFEDNISQKKPEFKIWFDQESYSIQDTIILYFLANRMQVDITQPIEFVGLTNIKLTHTSTDMRIENGKTRQLFLRLYKFLPNEKGTVLIESFKARIDGHRKSHKPIACEIK